MCIRTFFFLLAILTCCLSSAKTAAAQVVVLRAGTAVGQPGAVVVVPVFLETAGLQVGRVSGEIWFSPLTRVIVGKDGYPSCVMDPDVDPQAATFNLICTGPGDCFQIRAFVRADGNTLPEGALFSCKFQIDNDAPPASYTLLVVETTARGPAGELLDATGANGAIRVVTPTPTSTRTSTETVTPTETPTTTRTSTGTETHTATPTPTLTPTASVTPTETATSTPEGTRTVTGTGTVPPTSTATGTPASPGVPTLTATPISTRTATRTPTRTPTSPVHLSVSAPPSWPGARAELLVNLKDELMVVAQGSFELLLPTEILDVSDPPSVCARDPRLSKHQLTITALSFPPAPAGRQRVRFVLFALQSSPPLLGDGTLVRCSFPVKPGAEPGLTALVFARVSLADAGGNLVGDTATSDGALLIEPEAPLATATPTPSKTPGSPTPTSTPRPCPGDCTRNGVVTVDELVQGVRIALGNAPVWTCDAADFDGDGLVTVNELIAAVGSAMDGCSAPASGAAGLR